jgi:ubiquinone biosynthesis protein UbiJ
MLESLALPAINRLLRDNTWALERLRAHAGKVALFSCPPFSLRVSVTEGGELAHSPGSKADVTIGATPGILLRAAGRDPAAWNAAQVTGDAEFAAAFDYVRRNIEWDYEESLSRIVGDVAAHRLASATKQADLWARDSAFKLAQTLAEYVTHENPLVTSAQAVDHFNGDIDELRDDVERLEKRLELIDRTLQGR